MNSLFSPVWESNPLLINTVVSCVFKFLPLHEIKKYRLVCQEWNSVSEPILRKRGKIKFCALFRPSDFLNYYLTLNTNLPNLPFTAFKFPNVLESIGSFTSDLQNFVEVWGDKIKSLELEVITVMADDNGCHLLLDIRPSMDLVAANLTNLKIGIYPSSFSNLVVTLEKLVSIKTLFLSDCNVDVSSNGGARITPCKISLRDVAFQENGKKMQNVIVNDFVDFSKCKGIEIMCSAGDSPRGSKITFDLSRDTVNADNIDFCDIRLVNWGNAKVIVDNLILIRCPFAGKTTMQIKRLDFMQSDIDLSLLPNSIEKLKLVGSSYDLNENSSPTDILPNLRQLKLFPGDRQPLTFDSYSGLSQFANCSDLMDVEIGAGFTYNEDCLLNLSWLPKNIKKLKLVRPMGFQITVDDSINVDMLILDKCTGSFAQKVSNKINPKVLVAVLLGEEREEDRRESADRFISLITQNNKQLEKVVVKLQELIVSELPFEENKFFHIVDKESIYYEFVNQFGTAITEMDFKRYVDFH